MIKINLAARKREIEATALRGGGRSLATNLGITRITQLFRVKPDVDAFKGFPIKKIVLPILVAVLASYYLDTYREEEVTKLTAQIAAINAEKPKLVAEAGKLKNYEELKKNLEGDEFTIRTKVETIQKLIKGRASSPKMLTSLSGTVPLELWISEIKVSNDQVQIIGASSDFTQISDFMRGLSETVYFSDLNLKNTQQAKDENGYEVATFDLNAKRGQQ